MFAVCTFVILYTAVKRQQRAASLQLAIVEIFIAIRRVSGEKTAYSFPLKTLTNIG